MHFWIRHFFEDIRDCSRIDFGSLFILMNIDESITSHHFAKKNRPLRTGSLHYPFPLWHLLSKINCGIHNHSLYFSTNITMFFPFTFFAYTYNQKTKENDYADYRTFIEDYVKKINVRHRQFSFKLNNVDVPELF